MTKTKDDQGDVSMAELPSIEIGRTRYTGDMQTEKTGICVKGYSQQEIKDTLVFVLGKMKDLK